MKVYGVRRSPIMGYATLLLLSIGRIDTACAVDLLQVYHLAQSNDPTFEAARHTLAAVQEKIPEARAGLLPAITGSAGDDHSVVDSSYSGAAPIDRRIRAWNWTVQLTQPLLRLQNFYTYRESGQVVESAVAQYAQARQDLMLRVAQAYFDVLVAKEGVDAADAQQRAMAQQLAQTKSGFTAGAVAITDVDEAKAKLEQAHALRVAALNDLESKHAELEKVIGPLPLGELAVLKPAVVAPRPQPDDAQVWVSQARDAHPLVRAAQADLAAAQTEIQKNRAGHLPTVDLTESYGHNYSSGDPSLPSDFSTRAHTAQVGVQLSMPLYLGGSTQAQIAEAVANRDKAQAQLEAARRQAATDAREAYAGIVNGLAQIQALNASLEAADSAVKGNAAGYKLGIRINLDVLNAEQQRYTTRRDLAKARYDTLVQGLKLKAAVGVLGEADLVTLNALLAPPAPSTDVRGASDPGAVRMRRQEGAVSASP